MWTIFDVFIEFVIMSFLFSVFGILAVTYVGSWLSNQGSNLHPCIGSTGSSPLGCQAMLALPRSRLP